MKVQNVKIGKRVIYHPVIGGEYGEEAIITSEAYEMCGTQCCFIDIRSGCVDIEALEEV
jgi:hypothetical protein